MIGEEFPRACGALDRGPDQPRHRGVMLMAKLQPYILLPEGAEGNWLHDLGHGMVSTRSRPSGSAWRRGMARALRARPLPLVIVLVLRLACARRAASKPNASALQAPRSAAG